MQLPRQFTKADLDEEAALAAVEFQSLNQKAKNQRTFNFLINTFKRLVI